MGRGQKRGRTQRRHFKQNRDNVWKHNPNKPPAAAGGDTADAPVEENPKWEPFATQNPGFDEYYKVEICASWQLSLLLLWLVYD
jgi:multisite-specific tRNA:(cytosine-C5)-methyltransferase